MKNNKIRLLALMMIGTMIFAGCGKGKEAESDKDGKTGKDSQVESVEGEDVSADEDEEPKEYRLVECKEDIDPKAYELYLKDSKEQINNNLHMDIDECDRVHTGEDFEDDYVDSFAHKNFDSCKLVGVVVTPVSYEAHNNTVDFIYELNYSAHGDVTTYCAVVYFDVYTNDEELGGKGGIMSCVCDVDDYEYFGATTADDIAAQLAEKLKADGELVIDEDV